MRELTYILGAGASYESMPLVKSFPRRFMFFVNSMKELVNHRDVSVDNQTNVNILYSHSLDFYREISSHQSFDTFFKKLYHTGQYKTINLYKKVLNIYFLWEHITTMQGNADESETAVNIETEFIKRSRVDKRYDALIAGLLRPEKGIPQPYCKVNFITWNYDLNLLISLKNYYSPNIKIGNFLNNIDKKNGVWVVENQFTIININGFFYSSELDNSIKLENVNINDAIFKIIKGNYFEDKSGNEDSKLIKFAWEQENTSVSQAKKLIVDSDNIVVIGYTFPLYNRLIDLSYLEKPSIKNKRVYIQDPRSESIYQNIIDYYQLEDNKNLLTNLVHISDCDSFYIPSNIFGVKDGSGEYYFL